MKLERNLYWEIDLKTIEDLTKLHFDKSPNFLEDTGLEIDGHYPTDSIEKDNEEIVNSELIEKLLVSDDDCNDFYRIDHAIWLLIMKDVLPEGQYLVSL